MIEIETGTEIYVTQIAYKTLGEIQQRCRKLTVCHQTEKAIKLLAGTAELWLPKSMLISVRGRADVFLLKDCFRVAPRWRRSLGWRN